MNKATRAKIEKKAAASVAARHAGEVTDGAVEQVAKALKEKKAAKPVKIDKEIKAPKIKNGKLPELPRLPATARVRKDKPVKPCACGDCGETTKSVWAPGHDAYAKGWALRIERKVCKLSDVPEAVIAGVKMVLAERKKAAGAAEVKPDIKIVKAKDADEGAADVENIEVDQTETELSVVK